MNWPWSKRTKPRATDEAYAALARSKDQLGRAHELRAQAGKVSEVATKTIQTNHFGAAITAAMGGRQ